MDQEGIHPEPYYQVMVHGKNGHDTGAEKIILSVGDLPEATDFDIHLDNVSKLADRINVTDDEVIDMAARLKARDLSLDELLGDSSRDSFADTLRDERADQERDLAERQELQNLKRWVDEAVDKLNPREKYIVEKRILSDEPETLKELGKHFGVTRERARQIERAALQKLKGEIPGVGTRSRISLINKAKKMIR